MEIREGDALRTLAELEQEIGDLLLDGWKDLCLQCLAMLEPRLAPGALVLADDTDQDAMTDYLAYVRDPTNGYESVEFRSRTASGQLPHSLSRDAQADGTGDRGAAAGRPGARLARA